MQKVHSILAQNRLLEVSGNFSTIVPFYSPIDWRKIGDQERENMREEFRRLVIEIK